MRLGTRFFVAVLALTGANAAVAAPTPLFAASEPIRLTISGPMRTIARNAERSTDPHEATLTLHGDAQEVHPIRLSARGVSRRRRDICTFPPLRIEFRERPGAASLFRGQRRIKLVTHCQSPESFQQLTLLEYSAYRLFNILTPLSFRVRLAEIEYFDPGASSAATSRLGFLIEDVDDAAERNGLAEATVGDRIGVAQLSAREAGRYAVFQYMIGNLDWALNAGPAGEGCCHNTRLAGAGENATAGLIPLPYDFDHSGLVDAPYATPPEGVSVRSVRVRRYRGFCVHNQAARAAVAETLAARQALLGAFDEIPRLEERTRRRASAYLRDYFDAADSEAEVARWLGDCLGQPARNSR